MLREKNDLKGKYLDGGRILPMRRAPPLEHMLHISINNNYNDRF